MFIFRYVKRKIENFFGSIKQAKQNKKNQQHH